MGSMSHPNLTLPIASSAELPLTRHSVELGMGGHRLVSPKGARTRCWGRTLPQGHRISASCCCWQEAQRLSHPGGRSKPSPGAGAEALAEPGARSCPGYRGSSSELSRAGFYGGSCNGMGVREEQAGASRQHPWGRRMGLGDMRVSSQDRGETN